MRLFQRGVAHGHETGHDGHLAGCREVLGAVVGEMGRDEGGEGFVDGGGDGRREKEPAGIGDLEDAPGEERGLDDGDEGGHVLADPGRVPEAVVFDAEGGCGAEERVGELRRLARALDEGEREAEDLAGPEVGARGVELLVIGGVQQDGLVRASHGLGAGRVVLGGIGDDVVEAAADAAADEEADRGGAYGGSSRIGAPRDGLDVDRGLRIGGGDVATEDVDEDAPPDREVIAKGGVQGGEGRPAGEAVVAVAVGDVLHGHLVGLRRVTRMQRGPSGGGKGTHVVDHGEVDLTRSLEETEVVQEGVDGGVLVRREGLGLREGVDEGKVGTGPEELGDEVGVAGVLEVDVALGADGLEDGCDGPWGGGTHPVVEGLVRHERLGAHAEAGRGVGAGASTGTGTFG